MFSALMQQNGTTALALSCLRLGFFLRRLSILHEAALPLLSLRLAPISERAKRAEE